MNSPIRIVAHALPLLAIVYASSIPVFPAHAESPPPVLREFRAAWVATVANIDWPSQPGLSTAAQQQELTQLLDVAAELNLNAIVLQVRPACDAIYASKLEPWSPYLTGTMGVPPDPFYDPLQHAVEQAHSRGLELHAWFNPFRAKHAAAKGEVSDDHISRQQPEIVREYGKYLWLDPGEPAAIDHTLAVVMDVVNNYDIDGVHLDDYFYPYSVNDDDGNKVAFPDDASWEKRPVADANLTRDDWRRQNVDVLIRRMYDQVKQAKPWVKVGLSPFGIWRPNHPPGIQGFDAYAELYADSRKWLREGWVDYMTPQLYWRIESTGQSYPRLLEWWDAENVKQRHLWPGNYASRLGGKDEQRWDRQELLDQIQVTRDHDRATGNVYFSMKAFLRDYDRVNEKLKELYSQPALAPASPWLGNDQPQPPRLEWQPEQSSFSATPQDDLARWWVVQFKTGDDWKSVVLPAGATKQIDRPEADEAYVTAFSRTGVVGPSVKFPPARRP